jgi:outer membrane protein
MEHLHKKLLFLLLLALMGSQIQAQDVWSLERCIEHAAKNSLAVKQAQTRIRDAELLLEQSQRSWLPSANASTNAGYNFGRTIDPTSNSFLNRSIGFNSLSLNASAPLYTGGQISNTIKQNKLSTEAARLDANTTVNNLSLDVAVAYLNILLSEEQLNNARKRLDLSKAQLEQTDRLIEAGSRPRNERLNLVSQVALDQQTVIEGENTVINNYLILSQLMLLPPGEQIQIEKIDVIVPADVNPDTYKLVDVYNLALNTQPQIMAGEKRLASAQVAVEAAKASMRPRLSIFGTLTANASTQYKSISGYESTRISQTAYINNQAVNFEIPQNIPILTGQRYFDQINSTFGQSVGISLTVPIYNNDRFRIGVERSRLNVINTEITNQQLRQTLSSNVQRSITNARGSKRLLDAAIAGEDAARVAYVAAQDRYAIGAANSFDLSNARLNLDRAQIDLIRAKFQYVFNIKQVEFYQGKPLTLK